MIASTFLKSFRSLAVQNAGKSMIDTNHELTLFQNSLDYIFSRITIGGFWGYNTYRETLSPSSENDTEYYTTYPLYYVIQDKERGHSLKRVSNNQRLKLRTILFDSNAESEVELLYNGVPGDREYTAAMGIRTTKDLGDIEIAYRRGPIKYTVENVANKHVDLPNELLSVLTDMMLAHYSAPLYFETGANLATYYMSKVDRMIDAYIKTYNSQFTLSIGTR